MNNEWLDGPKFAAWLEYTAPVAIAKARRKNGNGNHLDRNYANLGRLLKRWDTGDAKAVSIYTADFYLTFLGLHLHQLPSDLFTGDPLRSNGGRKSHPLVPGQKGRKVPV